MQSQLLQAAFAHILVFHSAVITYTNVMIHHSTNVLLHSPAGRAWHWAKIEVPPSAGLLSFGGSRGNRFWPFPGPRRRSPGCWVPPLPSRPAQCAESFSRPVTLTSSSAPLVSTWAHLIIQGHPPALKPAEQQPSFCRQLAFPAKRDSVLTGVRTGMRTFWGPPRCPLEFTTSLHFLLP